ncbi:hypothetical protein V6N13_073439 [Hibiscus sabdariffa]|uniref:Uncharacterized protein n=2 Tax=Hibiscus sabdariffa TaxID=183260 RepID=A0ABR2A0R4_9ROSI
MQNNRLTRLGHVENRGSLIPVLPTNVNAVGVPSGLCFAYKSDGSGKKRKTVSRDNQGCLKVVPQIPWESSIIGQISCAEAKVLKGWKL